MSERKYLPTLADLIDRLSILLLKQVYSGDGREQYQEEAALVEVDVTGVVSDLLGFPYAEGSDVQGRFIRAVLVLMLANHVIWQNEAAVRDGGRVSDMLRYTHSINGVRSRAKNEIARWAGEREDRKVDCLAADLPPEFGQWDLFS